MCLLLLRPPLTPLTICDHLGTHLQVSFQMSGAHLDKNTPKNMETVLICWTALIFVLFVREKWSVHLWTDLSSVWFSSFFFHHYSCSPSSSWPPFLASSFLALCPLPSCFWSSLLCDAQLLGWHVLVFLSAASDTHMTYIKITLLITLSNNQSLTTILIYVHCT